MENNRQYMARITLSVRVSATDEKDAQECLQSAQLACPASVVQTVKIESLIDVTPIPNAH